MTDVVADTPTRDAPVVLIVEDRAGQRLDRATELRDQGCVPVAVESADAAARELIASPGIDLVLTDIHLVPQHEGDKSGVALAEFVKTEHPGIPVVGYSAYFSPGDLSAEELGVFDYRYAKGVQSIREIRVSLDRCVSLARETREQRRRKSAVRLESHVRAAADSASHEVLRSMAPTDLEEIERALYDAGFRLKVLRLPRATTADPIIVWVREGDGRFDVEIYGQPTLYAEGSTEDEAFEQLVELIYLYDEELQNAPEELAGPAKRLHGFLRHLDLPPRDHEAE